MRELHEHRPQPLAGQGGVFLEASQPNCPRIFDVIYSEALTACGGGAAAV